MWYATSDIAIHGVIEKCIKLVHLYKKRVFTRHENLSTDIKYYKLLYGDCAIHSPKKKYQEGNQKHIINFSWPISVTES